MVWKSKVFFFINSVFKRLFKNVLRTLVDSVSEFRIVRVQPPTRNCRKYLFYSVFTAKKRLYIMKPFFIGGRNKGAEQHLKHNSCNIYTTAGNIWKCLDKIYKNTGHFQKSML